MLHKTIDFDMDIKLSNKCCLTHNVGRNNYCVVGYIKTDIYFNNIKINLPIKALWGIIESQGMFENFREKTLDYIKELKEIFAKKCENKELERDTPFYDYLRDVDINYYESDSCFCIQVCAKNGLENMEKYWNSFLDKEWEKYKEKEHEVPFERSKKEELEERC